MFGLLVGFHMKTVGDAGNPLDRLQYAAGEHIFSIALLEIYIFRPDAHDHFLVRDQFEPSRITALSRAFQAVICTHT